MKKIRTNTFETNSSSTHSITICSQDEYEKWLNGELFYLNDKFYTEEERNKSLVECGYSDEEIEIIKTGDHDYHYDSRWESIPLSIEEYHDIIEYNYETFSEYANVNGVNVVAFGHYGDDY